MICTGSRFTADDALYRDECQQVQDHQSGLVCVQSEVSNDQFMLSNEMVLELDSMDNNTRKEAETRK